MESLFWHPQRNGRQANLGNTVLVNIGQMRKESDQWCLGYLQDVEGNKVLIDLDSAQFPPCWISAQFVWYHHLVEIKNRFKYPFYPPRLNVQVALRNEKDGPYVFRPAELLNCPSRESLYLCCVNMSSGEAGCHNGQEVQVVHHWQIVESLPPNEPSLFGRLKMTGSLDEIPVLKCTVHSEKVTAVIPLDERNVHRFVWRAVNQAGFARHNGTCFEHRASVRIDKDSMILLLLDLHHWRVVPPDGLWRMNAGGQREWTKLSEQKFSAEIEEHLEELGGHETHNNMLNLCTREEADPSIGMLSWDVLSEITSQLDLHSQMKAHRVSSAWHALLTILNPVVMIDFRNMANNEHRINADEGYFLGILMDRAVSQKTKVLALYHLNERYKLHGPPQALEVIRELLLAKKVELLVIKLDTFHFPCYEMIQQYDDADFTGHEMMNVSKLLPVCRRLLFANFTIYSPLVCLCHTEYLWSKQPKIFPTVFPYLEFDGTASEGENIMRYVEAVESHIDSVDGIKAQFKERHQFFVETLPYPDGWERFRQFLRRHTFTELSQSNSFWNELDLRDFDRLPLSKTALLLIDVCLRLAFDVEAD